MQNHTKIYLEYFGYSGYEFMPCEVCGNKAVDIHHIVPRSKFGSKTKHIQDAIENLIGLCRECHDKAHNLELDKPYLTEVHFEFMGRIL